MDEKNMVGKRNFSKGGHKTEIGIGKVGAYFNQYLFEGISTNNIVIKKILLVSNNSCCIVFNNRITRNFKIWFSGKKTSLESEMFRFRALLMYLEGGKFEYICKCS